MERDAGISHGASSFLRERLMLVSDAYQTVFCKTCGIFAVNDAMSREKPVAAEGLQQESEPGTTGYLSCKLCGDDKNFGRCTIPYAYKLLIHLLAAPGINLRPEFVTSEEYSAKVFRQRPLITEGTEAATITDIKTQLEQADEGLSEEEREDADEGLDADFAAVYDD
jgi:hypothetical protein